MSYCKECQAEILTPAVCCPLCGATLKTSTSSNQFVPYPIFVEKRNHYYFIRKMLFFLSILSTFFCIILNFITTPLVWWWPFYTTALLYAWLAIPHIFRKRGNIGGKLLMQVLCASLLFILLDFQIGWVGWSVNFGLPSLFCIGIVSIMILILVDRTNWARYVLYQLALALFGFIPIILYFSGVAQHFLSVFFPTLLAIISLLTLAIFGDRSIKNEFKRRLHF